MTDIRPSQLIPFSLSLPACRFYAQHSHLVLQPYDDNGSDYDEEEGTHASHDCEHLLLPQFEIDDPCLDRAHGEFTFSDRTPPTAFDFDFDLQQTETAAIGDMPLEAERCIPRNLSGQQRGRSASRMSRRSMTARSKSSISLALLDVSDIPQLQQNCSCDSDDEDEDDDYFLTMTIPSHPTLPCHDHTFTMVPTPTPSFSPHPCTHPNPHSSIPRTSPSPQPPRDRKSQRG